MKVKSALRHWEFELNFVSFKRVITNYEMIMKGLVKLSKT